MHQTVCRLGFAPDPTGGAYSAPLDRLAVKGGEERCKKGEGCPFSITERRVPELIPVLGSPPASDVNHKPGGRLPLLSARLAVTHATL